MCRRGLPARVSGVVAGATLVASTLFADLEKSQIGSREPPTQFAAIVRYEPLTGRLELRTRRADGGWETTDRIAPRWSGPFELEVTFDPASETFAWNDERGVFLEAASPELARSLRSADQIRIEVMSADAHVSARLEAVELWRGMHRAPVKDFGRGPQTRDRASMPLRNAAGGFRLAGTLALAGSLSAAKAPVWVELGFGTVAEESRTAERAAEGGTYTFDNFSAITIPASGTTGAASPYPSLRTVSGPIGGLVEDVNVWLLGVVHSYPDDLDVLLEAPRTQKEAWVVSDACGGENLNQQTWYFVEEAAAAPADEASCVGPFHLLPKNYGLGDSMPPGPVSPFEDDLDLQVDPNGWWRLYVSDDAADDTGSFDGGWSLELTTGFYIALVPGTGYSGSAAPYPYEDEVFYDDTFFGEIVDLEFGFAVSHAYPDDLDVLVVSPSGTSVILFSDICGSSASVSSLFWIFDDDAPAYAPDQDSAECLQDTTFKPSNYETGDSWPGAPAGPYGGTLSAFSGESAEGEWRFYVVDDSPGDAGFLGTLYVSLAVNGIFRDGFEGDDCDDWSNEPSC